MYFSRLSSTNVFPNFILIVLVLFFKDFVYLFLEEKGEREGENYQCVVASREALTGDLAPNPGMCPGWELNQ